MPYPLIQFFFKKDHHKNHKKDKFVISLRMFILMSIIHNNHRRKWASKNAKIEVT